MKITKIIIGLGIIFICAFGLYQKALIQPTYEGVPTVPCLDYTKPVLQHFTFSLNILIQGKASPLDHEIGHDAGNCLHEIYVDDASGTVYIRANDVQLFTLGQFFDVWRKTFTEHQIFSYQTTNSHTLSVFINGQKVTTFRETILKPQQEVQIRYE
jgi:hypothetical protein